LLCRGHEESQTDGPGGLLQSLYGAFNPPQRSVIVGMGAATDAAAEEMAKPHAQGETLN